MSRRILLALTCVLTLSAVPTAQQQRNALQAATETLGVPSLRSLRFTATGQSYVLGQPPSASEPWPVRPVKNYEVTLVFGAGGSMRIDQTLVMPTPQPRGGGAPFNGEQRQIQLVNGLIAWNETPNPQGGQPAAQPQPAAAVERMVWMWMVSPQGVLKAAGNVPTRAVGNGTEVVFTVGGRYRMTALINRMNQVERVETAIPNDVLGDMAVVTTYSGYRNFGGVQFPSRIVQTEGGYPTLELTVSNVEANAFVSIDVPESVRTATAPAVTVMSQKVAEGIFWLTGGSHHSLAVDMGDHVVMIEAPQNEARSEAVIAETKKLIPNKPIRYVVNTHIHFDHSGGLRTYVDEGATVVTHQANRAFYAKAWAAPRALMADRLSKSRKTAMFQTVTDRGELRGSNGRTIELHLLQKNPHNEQLLVAWLPAEKILFQSDMMNPPAPNTPAPPPTPTITNFYDNLQRLNIQPQQIVGGHGNRISTLADLRTVAGKTGTN